MFTGVIQRLGIVTQRRTLHSAVEFQILVKKPWKSGFSEGESIAVNGVCLTVAKHSRRSFTVQAVPETLNATTLGSLGKGSRVNLEKSLRLGDSLGGHFVFGHVDTKSKILEKVRRGKNYLFTIELPKSLRPYLISKGSIAVDGISLTVQGLKADYFTCAIIPHTAQVTTLGEKGTGDEVNLEADMMAKQLIHHLKKLGFKPKQ